MKKILIALTIAACMMMTACGGNTRPDGRKAAEVPNSWTDCATIEEASELAGFTFYAPEKLNDYPYTLIQASKKGMIQVLYGDKELDAEDCNTIMVRKGLGIGNISGDETEYPEKSSTQAGGFVISKRGKDGLVYNAIWNDGEYSYAIVVKNGMSGAEIEEFVDRIR